eukprot:m51a1_g14070 hypothetical protein (305) ;mRNA; f:1240906-1242250
MSDSDAPRRQRLTGADGKELAVAPKPPPKLKEVAHRALAMRSSDMDAKVIRRLNLTVSELRAQISQMSKEMEMMRRQEMAWKTERETMQKGQTRLQERCNSLQTQLDTVLRADGEGGSMKVSSEGGVTTGQIMTPSGIVTIGKSTSFIMPHQSDWQLGANDQGTPHLPPLQRMGRHWLTLFGATTEDNGNLSWSVQHEGEKIVLTAQVPEEGEHEHRSENGLTRSQEERSRQLDKNLKTLRSIVLMVTKQGLVMTPSGVADLKSQVAGGTDQREIADARRAAEKMRPHSSGGTALPIVTPAGTL